MKKPNIIMIMSDDQGYGDLSCMGNTDFITPNLDRLAESGARLTNFYCNSPVCSPSRASLITGRYPYKAGVRAIVAGTRGTTGITSDVPTIATALKDIGYNTGIVGKWHLGLADESHPNANGFDRFFGFMAGCIDYYSHIFYWEANINGNNPTHDLWDNEKEVYCNGQYFTELVTEKSIDFIAEHSCDEEPFMLYIGYNAPHYPMHAPQKYMDRFKHLSWDRQVMAAMISCMDDGVGDIVDELKRRGIYENTIIYFQSDNGPSRESRNWLDGNPDPYYGGTSGGLKGHKFSLFEGGIRIPAIISWPEGIPSGQIIDEPCISMDIFPTVLNAAGGKAEQYEIDGLDIMAVLKEKANSPHDMIFWEIGEQTAVRQGEYKLVLNGQLEENQPVQSDVHLANLIEDPGEKNNLAKKMPDLTQRLKTACEAWRSQLEQEWASKKHGTLFR